MAGSTRARPGARRRLAAALAGMALALTAGVAAPAAPAGGAPAQVAAPGPAPATARQEGATPLTAPADADVAAMGSPTPLDVTVAPATGLVDRQVVQVTVAEPPDWWSVVQCDAAVGTSPDLTTAIDLCAHETIGEADGTIDFRVSSSFTSIGGRTVHCQEPGDCVIAAAGLAASMWGIAAIDVSPAKLLVDPDRYVAVGQEVSVRVAVEPDITADVAQCAVPVGATLAASTCGPVTTVETGPEGTVTTSLTATGRIGSSDCVSGACAVALFAADGTVVTSVPLQFRQPLEVTATPADGVLDGTSVRATVTGWRDAGPEVAQCAASVLDTRVVADGPCTGATGVDAGGEDVVAELRVRRSFTGADGDEVTCGVTPGDCVIAVGDTAGGFAATPLAFATQPVATLSPATGLWSGDTVTVTGTGLPPGRAYETVLCVGPRAGRGMDDCRSHDDVPAVVASAAGTLSTDIPVFQEVWVSPVGRDGSYRYCRDTCSVGLQPVDAPRDVDAWAPFTMAGGSLRAEPSAGLADGDPVAVTLEVQPSYNGGRVWIFAAGSWGLGQCSAALLEDPTIAGVLRHCATPPGGGPVNVPIPGAMPAPAPVEAQATVRPFLGGAPTDCTAAPGACVLAVARVELDGSTSVVSTPLTFGGG